MRFRDCTKNGQAQIVFGAVLVGLGLVLLFSGFSAWWFTFFVWMRQASRLLVPLALIGIGIYVVWASRNNKFAQTRERMQANWGTSAVLHRSTDDMRIAGVCGGIAQYFGIESTIVRVIAVLLACASPLLTLIAYGVLVFALHKT